LLSSTAPGNLCASGEQTAWGISMIKLTRLDGEQFVLNADLIRYVERRPDTFITLTSGERLVVAESMDEVVERAVRYQQQKHFLPMPVATPPPTTVDPSLSH
jgi:flagellar protein FlbD